MCRAMCRPGVLVQHTWRVGAPVSRVGRRAVPARNSLAEFTSENHACTEGIDPGEFRGGAICALLRRPSLASFRFWKLLGRAAHMPLHPLVLPAGMRLG